MDQEKMSHDEPFYLDLRCLQSHLFSIMAFQELNSPWAFGAKMTSY